MRDRINGLVKARLEEINEELDYESLRRITEETPIFGGESGIDSLSLVNLIVGLEGEIQKSFGKKISLADEKAMSARNSPFRTVGSLVEFVVDRLG